MKSRGRLLVSVFWTRRGRERSNWSFLQSRWLKLSDQKGLLHQSQRSTNKRSSISSTMTSYIFVSLIAWLRDAPWISVGTRDCIHGMPYMLLQLLRNDAIFLKRWIQRLRGRMDWKEWRSEILFFLSRKSSWGTSSNWRISARPTFFNAATRTAAQCVCPK